MYHSRYTSPQPSFWQALPRVACVGVGLLFATGLLIAEYHYAVGWRQGLKPTEAVRHLELAQRFFLPDYRFRAGAAYYYASTRWKGSGPDAIASMRHALSLNPWSLDIRRNLAGFLLEQGDEKGALAEIAVINRAHPGLPVAVQVNQNPATR